MGVFFSICVSLTHFCPRPHPTVPCPKHMCGGRGISEPSPRGTCRHTLQIWHWTLLSCLSASHSICHHGFFCFFSSSESDVFHQIWLSDDVKLICACFFFSILASVCHPESASVSLTHFYWMYTFYISSVSAGQLWSGPLTWWTDFIIYADYNTSHLRAKLPK